MNKFVDADFEAFLICTFSLAISCTQSLEDQRQGYFFFYCWKIIVSIFSFYSSVQDRTIAIVWTRVWKAYRISHFPFCLVDLHLLQKKCLLLTVVVSLHDFKFDRRSIIIYNEIVKFAIYHQRPLEFSILENLAMHTWHDTPFIAKCLFKIFHWLNLHFHSSFP